MGAGNKIWGAPKNNDDFRSRRHDIHYKKLNDQGVDTYWHYNKADEHMANYSSLPIKVIWGAKRLLFPKDMTGNMYESAVNQRTPYFVKRRKLGLGRGDLKVILPGRGPVFRSGRRRKRLNFFIKFN